ncbi:MAG TPA: UDP-N-acetylmuramoyl-L-alanyl-D-glutamate--2,6-diaminopimelate ligase [Candidatus Binatia bacterium]|nr:UDP-N-acetylmuramoyl-L-alanyl-D-glutamate--2,6-diaminopimelate ligase [Candidatus Binatia bacterium]
MRLSELLRRAGITAPPEAMAGRAGTAGGATGAAQPAADPDVRSVDYDSRRCAPGSLFVAVAGLRADGRRFAAQAVSGGAVAVVAEREPDPPVAPAVPLVLVPNSRMALSALAAALAGHPSRRMTVAGVTGTDGKTTTSTMLWSAWHAAGIPAASITTVDTRVGTEIRPNPSHITTLEAPELQGWLEGALAAGCTHTVLETSSHGLQMHRVDGVDYDIAVYTRVTSEHLDIHGTRDEYLRTKARLLDLVGPRPGGLAVLDLDDDFAYPLLSRAPVARRLTYSVTGRAGADLRAEELRVVDNCVCFTAATPWGRYDLELGLAGSFNAGNALAALAAACGSGAPPEDAVRGIAGLKRVTGRMERIDVGQDFLVVVDYAHTAAALETVLAELRPVTKGRLWAVFGSAGERDREKRGAMGAAAARLADILVVTDEDPRGEDRDAINQEIARGAEAQGAARGVRLHVIADRTLAVDFAVSGAAPGDTVLLAGKGHENTIEMADGPIPWDEHAVARKALRRRGYGGGGA